MSVIGDQLGLTLDRIVLATDFTAVAERAAAYARGLAKRFASTLTLAHAVDLSLTARTEEEVAGVPLNEMRNTSAENQERLLCDMTAAGIRTNTRTMESHHPALAIVDYAKELRADLIVTGTHARHGFEKVILGSFAEGIIRHATCPVLTIGPKSKPAVSDNFSLQTVVFATDFSSSTALQAAVALSFAQDSVAKIYLCHVLDDPKMDICQIANLELQFEESLQGLIPHSTYDWSTPERVVETGEVAASILDLATRVRADLIVLGAKHSGTWFTHLVQGTVDKVLFDAECPVLTVCAN